MMDGDPIMDAPPQGDADTTERYLRSRNTSGHDSRAAIATVLLVLVGGVFGLVSGGSAFTAVIGAALPAGLFVLWRRQSARSARRRDIAAEQAAYAVKAAMKEKEIEAARTRGDFDRFNKT
jgi:hypothetical protein